MDEKKSEEKRSLRPGETAAERSEEIATGRGSQRPVRTPGEAMEERPEGRPRVKEQKKEQR